jgi:hypothetical protein
MARAIISYCPSMNEGAGSLRPRNHRALFLGKRRKQMQDERINIRPKLGNYELHTLCHQARDEVYVAAEAVQLGHGNGAGGEENKTVAA